MKTEIFVIFCVLVLAINALEVKNTLVRVGPIKLGPKGIVEKMTNVERPAGRIATKNIKFTPVFATGEEVPKDVAIIHHFALCYDDKFDMFTCPKWNEDFAGIGGEFVELEFPSSHYFITEAASNWLASFHAISRTNVSTEIYMQCNITYIALPEGPLPDEVIPIRPFRLDMGWNCEFHFIIKGGNDYALNSRTWLSPFGGTVVKCISHMHLRAISLEAKVDNQLLCKSVPSFIPVKGDDIEMSQCDTNLEIKKGQIIELVSLYDTKGVEKIHGAAAMICFITDENYAKKN